MKKMVLNNNGFEDRESDWLAQERKYEAGISAWDIDDPKSRHSMSRDAQLLKANHKDRHDVVRSTYTTASSSRVASERRETVPGVKPFLIMLITYLIVFMFIASMIMGMFI